MKSILLSAALIFITFYGCQRESPNKEAPENVMQDRFGEAQVRQCVEGAILIRGHTQGRCSAGQWMIRKTGLSISGLGV